MEIRVFDRQKKEYFTEKVYGEKWLARGYNTFLGKALVGNTFFQRFVSHAAGNVFDSPSSVAKISEFVKQYDIHLDEFEGAPYQSFNEFFIRPYRKGLREFPNSSSEFGSPAEGRLSVFAIDDLKSSFAIKGQKCSLEQLIAKPGLLPLLKDMTHFWVFRLCPVDYHCFHFPDSGFVQGLWNVSGELHSVNPYSLRVFPDVFIRNERQWTLFQSDHFGELLLGEVGAMCVGKIEQTFEGGHAQARGQKKGHFKFGASTVLMLSSEKHLVPSQDLLDQCTKGTEVLVRLGEVIGQQV